MTSSPSDVGGMAGASGSTAGGERRSIIRQGGGDNAWAPLPAPAPAPAPERGETESKPAAATSEPELPAQPPAALAPALPPPDGTVAACRGATAAGGAELEWRALRSILNHTLGTLLTDQGIPQIAARGRRVAPVVVEASLGSELSSFVHRLEPLCPALAALFGTAGAASQTASGPPVNVVVFGGSMTFGVASVRREGCPPCKGYNETKVKGRIFGEASYNPGRWLGTSAAGGGC